jgi:acetyl esterase/lipase
VPLPECVIAFAPCTNLADDLPSRTTNDATDLTLAGDSLRGIYDNYIGDGDPRNPYVSPVFGNFEGFPPLFVIVDDGEVLFDDAEQVVSAARRAGVDVQYQIVHGLFHTYEVLGKMIPESKQAMKDTVAFIYKWCGVKV